MGMCSWGGMGSVLLDGFVTTEGEGTKLETLEGEAEFRPPSTGWAWSLGVLDLLELWAF